MNPQAKDFKLLIADDSRIYRRLFEDAFTKQEYSVVFAKCGRAAMDLFTEHKPDLVITDWMMPDLTGVELCRQVRGSSKDSYTYIIIVTSNSDKREILAGLSAGADDYLTKPFSPAELRARVGVGFRVIGFHRQLETKTRLLEELALTDELTGLPNRRAVENWAKREISGAVRHHFPVSVVMADLDRFKRLNDSFGHEAGDTVLRKFAQILKRHCRSCDMYGRFGGEEFVIVLTHSDLKGAFGAIENVREKLAEQIFTFDGHDVVVTASFGIATLEEDPEDFNELVARADRALYSAKQSGRNRIGLAKGVEPPIPKHR